MCIFVVLEAITVCFVKTCQKISCQSGLSQFDHFNVAVSWVMEERAVRTAMFM